MDKSELVKHLKEVIEEQTESVINSDDQELDLDSFTMMLVITAIGDRWNVELDMETLDFDKFNTLNSLAEQVQSQA